MQCNGHSLSSDTIVKKMKEYRDRTDTWTMVKKLQARFIARDYFLLWSTDYMDTVALTKAIHKEIELISEEKIQFALTWSPIKGENGRTYQCAKPDRYKKKELSAIHIQVPNDEKDVTYEMLRNFFGLDNITPILGREMLMVPIIRATSAAHKNENIEHLISKQHYFYTQMEYTKSFDFSELDRPEKTLKKTARDMVMSLQTLDRSNTKLFWSIDKDKTGATYLAYPSHLADYARN